MQLFRFDPEVGSKIDRYESSGFIISGVAQVLKEAVVNCAHLSPGGGIGYHQAAAPQLFLVVQGEGWVRAESGGRMPIRAGQAAFWGEGEWHESGTGPGMTAIIIESRDLDPANFMPLV